jgi:hypothetical protein
MSKERLTEFIVMDIENIDTNMNESRAAIKHKFRQVKLEVARKSDFGVNDKTYHVNCNLGDLLTYNDTVLGYDLEYTNNKELEEFKMKCKHLNFPEIIIVKKINPRNRKKNRKRNWTLK